MLNLSLNKGTVTNTAFQRKLSLVNSRNFHILILFCVDILTFPFKGSQSYVNYDRLISHSFIDDSIKKWKIWHLYGTLTGRQKHYWMIKFQDLFSNQRLRCFFLFFCLKLNCEKEPWNEELRTVIAVLHTWLFWTLCRPFFLSKLKWSIISNDRRR